MSTMSSSVTFAHMCTAAAQFDSNAMIKLKDEIEHGASDHRQQVCSTARGGAGVPGQVGHWMGSGTHKTVDSTCKKTLAIEPPIIRRYHCVHNVCVDNANGLLWSFWKFYYLGF